MVRPDPTRRTRKINQIRGFHHRAAIPACFAAARPSGGPRPSSSETTAAASTCDWRDTPSAPLAALKPPFSRERAAVDQHGERCHVRDTGPERVHIFRFPAARPSPVSHYARVPEPTQRRERLTTSLTAHLPRRCILRRIYSRGGGRGSGHGFSSKDARRGGLGDHCRRLFLPSGDAAPAFAGCPRGGWGDPDRRIRKPVASARSPVLILDVEAPLWSQHTQATPVVGTASGVKLLPDHGGMMIGSSPRGLGATCASTLLRECASRTA